MDTLEALFEIISLVAIGLICISALALTFAISHAHDEQDNEKH